MESYYLHYNGVSVFVKEASFFEDQKRANPKWDTSAWKGPIHADSIDHARMIGERMVTKGEL